MSKTNQRKKEKGEKKQARETSISILSSHLIQHCRGGGQTSEGEKGGGEGSPFTIFYSVIPPIGYWTGNKTCRKKGTAAREGKKGGGKGKKKRTTRAIPVQQFRTFAFPPSTSLHRHKPRGLSGKGRGVGQSPMLPPLYLKS